MSDAAASTEPLSAVAEALHYFGAHRPDSPRHAAWVALDKFLEGDPDVVLPSEPLAGSQAGSNGPSGSPTSPSGRDSAASLRHRAFQWCRHYLFYRLRWRLGLAPPSGHPSISNEPFNRAQMRRAAERSKRENWKDIRP